MKIFKYVVLVLILLSGIACNGQTSEQKKKAAEIEAMAAEMQRKGDSIMNTPEMKKMMEQAMTMEAAQKAKHEKGSAEVKLSIEKQATTSSNTDYLKDFTISNGSFKKFDSWQFGSAELYVIKYLPFGKDIETQYKVGSISADGSFDFTMPQYISCETKSLF